jgi:hypothetical protein
VLLEGKSLRLSKQAMTLLGASAGMEIGFTPLSRPDAPEPQAKPTAKVDKAGSQPRAGKSRAAKPRAAKLV